MDRISRARAAHPLAAVAGRLLGSAGRDLLLACTAIAVFGSSRGHDQHASRVLRRGERWLLPRPLTTVHTASARHMLRSAVYAVLVFAFTVSGAFRPLAVLATISQLLIYLFLCLGVLRFAG